MKRVILAAAILGMLVAVPAANAAKPKLPSPKSKIIKPNAGVGGVELGKRMKPRPRGWRHPFDCRSFGGLSGCAWTTRTDALPPKGQKDISGPYVIVGGKKNVQAIIIGAGDKNPNTRPLRRWKTRKGTHFGDTLSKFRDAYPEAQSTIVPGSYHIVKGRRTTAFVFVDGRLRTIEMVVG